MTTFYTYPESTPNSVTPQTQPIKRKKRPSNDVGSNTNAPSPKKRPKSVVTTNRANNATAKITEFPTTGKTLTYQQVTNRLNTYKGYIKQRKRKKDNNEARVNYYSYLLDKMHNSDANKVDEIKFEKHIWLNYKKPQS